MTDDEKFVHEASVILSAQADEINAIVEKAKSQNRPLTPGEKWQARTLSLEGINIQKKVNEIFKKHGLKEQKIIKGYK